MLTKPNLFLIIFSFSFIPIWGLTMLEPLSKTNFSIFVSLFYTVIAIQYIKNKFSLKNIQKFIILIGPLFYVFIGLYSFKENLISFFISPIFYGFILITFSLFFLNKLSFEKIIMILFISYFYPYHLAHLGKTPFFKQKTKPNLEIILFEHKFLNSKFDTINFSSNEGKLILVETWHEKCSPCIKAIDQIEEYIDTYKDKIDHRYLYVGNNPDSVIINKFIKNKSKSFIDYQFIFNKKLKFKSYPGFILFDNRGKVIDYKMGFSGKEKMKKELDKMFNIDKLNY